MTIQQLLETLIKKREALDVAISEIYKAQAATNTRHKAAQIVTSTPGGMNKGFKYNGTHWTQKPENKDKVMRMAKLRNKMRRQRRND